MNSWGKRSCPRTRLFGEPIGLQPPRTTQLQDADQHNPRMSKQPIDNASLKINRKRAPLWPFATRSLCEQVVKLLIEDDLVRGLSPRMNGGSSLQPKPVKKTPNTRGGCGSPITSTPGISPNCVSTLKTLPSLEADRASKEASYSVLIPLSPNYFDVLSKEEDAPPKGTLERERESPRLHTALALSGTQRKKPPCLFKNIQRRQRKRISNSRYT